MNPFLPNVTFLKLLKISRFSWASEAADGRCSSKLVVLKWKNFAIFQGKQLYWSLFLIKLQGNFIKKRLRHRYFPVNNA